MKRCVYCNNELTESENICYKCGSLQFNFNKLYDKSAKDLDSDPLEFFMDELKASIYNEYGTEDGEFRGVIFDKIISELHERREKIINSGKYKPNGLIVQDDLYPVLQKLEKCKLKFDKKILRSFTILKDGNISLMKRINTIADIQHMRNSLYYALHKELMNIIDKSVK